MDVALRLSSKLFQHKTNPKVPDYTFDFALEISEKIGIYNEKTPFNISSRSIYVLSSFEKAYRHTLEDLEYHAMF